MNRGFKLWKMQSASDLRKYRREVEKGREEAILPYNKQIEEIDRLIKVMEGGEAVVEAPKKKSEKGRFSYNGTHWTQQPENREKVRQITFNAARQARLKKGY